MKQYIIFALLLSYVYAQASAPDKVDTFINALIQEHRAQELKALENDPKNKALLDAVNAQVEAECAELEKKDQWLDAFFKKYGNKQPEELLDPTDPKEAALLALYKLGKSEHKWLCLAIPPVFIYSLIKPADIMALAQDQQIQKITTHQLAQFLSKRSDHNKGITMTLSAHLECSVKPSDVLAGCAEYALSNHLNPSSHTTTSEHTLRATTTVLGRLIERSIKPTQVKSVVATDNILVLSNRNITYAACKTLGDAVKESPDHAPSPGKLAQNFAQNVGFEAAYNLTAQLLRPVAQELLPEGLVEMCLPHDYEPKHLVHESVKYAISRGVALTAACIAHALVKELNKAPLYIPGI